MSALRFPRRVCLLLLLLAAIFTGYVACRDLQPVKIIAVHNEGNFSDILVKNFPVTERGRIDWWLKNKDMLKEKFHIPEPASNGFFFVKVWDFAAGYMEQGKYDRLCFDEMKTKTNCIEKNSLMLVRNDGENEVSFAIGENLYKKDKNGKYSRADN